MGHSWGTALSTAPRWTAIQSRARPLAPLLEQVTFCIFLPFKTKCAALVCTAVHSLGFGLHPELKRSPLGERHTVYTHHYSRFKHHKEVTTEGNTKSKDGSRAAPTLGFPIGCENSSDPSQGVGNSFNSFASNERAGRGERREGSQGLMALSFKTESHLNEECCTALF